MQYIYFFVQGYLTYFRGLPINDSPEIFGLHDNANISFAQNETFALLGTLVKLQPRVAASGGKSRDEVCIYMHLCKFYMPIFFSKNMYTTVQMFGVIKIVLKKVMFLLSILKSNAFSFW